MIRGQHVGLGTEPSRVGLYCRVTKVAGNEVHYHVINGQWDFKITPQGAFFTDYKNGEKLSATPAVLFSGPIPDFGWDYESALTYMNERITSRWYFPRLAIAWAKVSSPFIRFKSAFSAGMTAFGNVWSGSPKGKTLVLMEDEDDDIPF